MMFKRTILSFVTLFSLLYPASSSMAQESDPKGKNDSDTRVSLTIFHTNDFHSRLNGYSPVSEYSPLTINNDQTLGGIARMASILKNERAKCEGQSLTLDAGDFTMGTFFASLEASTGFQLGLMNDIGYDAIAIGNHEFDAGPEYLSQIISKSLEHSELPPLLLSNVKFDIKDPADDALQELYDKNVLQPYHIVEIEGIKIGILGLLGEDAIIVAPSMRPCKGLDPIKTARKYVRILKNEEKVDHIILLGHTGIVMGEDGNWKGDDRNLAEKVPGIDLIISGHSHTELQDIVYINGVPIVQAKSYGEYIGKTEIIMNKEHLLISNYELLPVDDRTKGNKKIQAEIELQKKRLEEKILKQFDLKYDSKIVESSFPLLIDEDTLLFESNLGRFISQALYEQLNTYDSCKTDIAIFPAGLIRDNMSVGIQTTADIFRIASLGNGQDDVPGYPIAKVYVTGKELKGILELIYLASSMAPGSFCYYGGLNIEYNPDGGFLKKITKAELTNYSGNTTEIDFSRKNTTLYSLAADSYLMDFLALFKKMTFGIVKVEPKYKDGRRIEDIPSTWIDGNLDTPVTDEIKTWLCLIEYVQSLKDTNGNGIPEIPEKFKLEQEVSENH